MTPTEGQTTTEAADILAGLSPTALRALRELAREPNPTFLQPMGGNARGPILSSCRSLVKKGLMRGNGGSRYGLTDAGLPVAMEALRRWLAERDEQKSTGAKTP